MSLLQQESGNEAGDAARGEEITKGSSHMIATGIVAAVLVTIAIAIFLLAGEKKPVVSGEIVQVWAHPRHVETSGIDANGEAMAKESFDEVLVFAHVKLHNESRNSLVMQDVLANVKQADGILSVSAGSTIQYDEVFLAYPEIAALRANALSPRVILDPGQSVGGTVFWAIRLSKQEWDARKELNFTFRFQYQPSLVLAPHNAVTEH
jgi:hypothetical protein